MRAVVGLTGPVAERGYSALLKVLHGPDDPRIPLVFTRGRDLVRLHGKWANGDTSGSFGKDIQGMLRELPAVLFPDKKGDLKPCAGRVNLFQQSVDLSAYGFPALTSVRGMPVYGHRLEYDNPQRVNIVVPSRELRADAYARYRPRYVPVAKRQPLADAWTATESVFPGVDRNYLLLLLAAKGVAEGNVGLTPLIFVAGPSGAGKSATVTLAAAIAGDHNTEVVYNRDSDRFRAAIAEGTDAGTYVTFNECLKEGSASGRSARETLDVVLNLTADSVSHKLYLGPVALGRLPVMVFSDTALPQEVRDDAQLARRFVVVKLARRVDWVSSLASSGVRRITRFRVADAKYAAASDALMSHVIDEYFDRPRDLTEIAESLGFSVLEDSDDFADTQAQLREFFDALCRAPPLTGSYVQRWPGRGWKLIHQSQQTELREKWDAIHDGGNFYDSRVVRAHDWARLLDVDADVHFDLTKSGPAIAVRFRTGSHLQPLRVNEEIYAASTGSRSVGSSAIRPGDAERGGFEPGWGATLCGRSIDTAVVDGVLD
jgi:hypothetical protein